MGRRIGQLQDRPGAARGDRDLVPEGHQLRLPGRLERPDRLSEEQGVHRQPDGPRGDAPQPEPRSPTRYVGGVSSYLEVLDTERQRLTAEQQLAQAQRDVLTPLCSSTRLSAVVGSRSSGSGNCRFLLGGPDRAADGLPVPRGHRQAADSHHPDHAVFVIAGVVADGGRAHVRRGLIAGLQVGFTLLSLLAARGPALYLRLRRSRPAVHRRPDPLLHLLRHALRPEGAAITPTRSMPESACTSCSASPSAPCST